MLIGLAVRLAIPDTTAHSARQALQHAGLRALTDVQREVCWNFDVPDSEQPGAIAERLLAVDVLLNVNKHRGRWWQGPMEAAATSRPGSDAARPGAFLLVEDRDDPALPQMQRVLRARLGFAGLSVVRHGTLWWLAVATAADATTVAERAASMLLVNPHGQAAITLGGSPAPVGGVPARQYRD